MNVCRLTPDVQHWMPTREAWVLKHIDKAPANLVIRFSMPMVDQEAAGSWRNTSTVTTARSTRTCPAPDQDNACGDCRACWNPEVRNIAYGQH
jgi:7-cyano-7-deazaguanine synthase in queuosine biosynthesis